MENYATEFGYRDFRFPLPNENFFMDVVLSHTFMPIMVLFTTIMIPCMYTPLDYIN